MKKKFMLFFLPALAALLAGAGAAGTEKIAPEIDRLLTD